MLLNRPPGEVRPLAQPPHTMNHLDTLPDPDQVGSAEYRAIHDLLTDAETPADALAICQAFADWAEACRREIQAATPAPTQHRHPRALDDRPHLHD